MKTTKGTPGRHAVGLLSRVAVIAALLGTGLVIGWAYRGQREAGRDRINANATERLARRVAEVDAAEWQLAATNGSNPDALAELESSRRNLTSAVRRVKRLGESDAELLRASRAYVAALAQESGLLARHRIEDARRVDLARVDTAHDLLRAATVRVAAHDVALAQQTATKADRLTWLAAALGTATLALLVLQLVTQRRLLHRERDHLAQLQSVDRLKDEFTASVSHELRTPLTSIRGYLELLLDGEAGELTSEQRNFMTIVDRNSDRLLTLVGDLLDVAQIEAGQMSLELTDEELSSFLEESVEAARPRAAKQGVELVFHPNGQAWVRVDSTRFGQAIDNLLSNAIKFTDSGGSVDVRLASSNGAAIAEIADTGIGMSPDEQTRLFQRFYRTAAAGERAIPGTGLGLWITKAIVEAHGGEINVQSVAGRGTTFRVGLPTGKGPQ